MRWSLGFAAALALAANPAGAATKRAFLTSTTCLGILGPCSAAADDDGVEAANNICQERAAAAGLDSGGATYRAWLSDTASDAYCNVLGLSGQRNGVPHCGVATLPEAGPWERVDGVPFAESISDLVDVGGTPLVPMSINESGAFVANGFYKSGSLITGAYDAVLSCAGWTVEIAGTNTSGGNPETVGQDWISGGSTGCQVPTRLTCFELGAGDPLSYPSVPGALVFVTSTSGTGKMPLFPGSGGAEGLDGADAVCQERAAAAFLPAPESFVAWLSDSTRDAALRLTTDGPWKRVDGVAVADSLADLVDSRLWTAFLLTESGGHFEHEVWTGTTALGDATLETCLDWASEDSGQGGTVGRPWRAGGEWTEAGPSLCSNPNHLYCFSNRVALGWDNFESGDLRRWSTSAVGP